MCEVEVFNEDLCGFVGARACVVKEQEKKMIALPLRTLEVWGCEECIYFGLLQINAGRLCAFLKRYDADLFAPSDMFGAVQGHEAGQRVEGCQALVPCRNGAAPALLQMKKEHPHPVGGYVDHIQSIDALASLTSAERNQQSKGVPIALLRASGQIPLLDQVFEKEAPDSGTESAAVSHGSPPRKHIGRSVGWPRVTTRESS